MMQLVHAKPSGDSAMNRYWLSFVAAILFTLSAAPGVSRGQDKDKKDPNDVAGKSIGQWIEMLRKDEDPKHRRAALIVLEATNSASRVGLFAVLDATTPEKEKDAEVRRHAVLLVGRLGPEPKGTTRALIDALQNDKAGEVREAAATSLGGTKFVGQAKEYLSVLIDKLKDPHAGTRGAVVSTLRNMEGNAAPAVPALIELAKDAKEPV